MTGTLLNTAAILVGGGLGMLLGSRLSPKLKQTVVAGLGLFTLVFGISMFLKTQNSLIVLGALVLGTILGEVIKLEEGVAYLGDKLEKRFNGAEGIEGRERFIKGFSPPHFFFALDPWQFLGQLKMG